MLFRLFQDVWNSYSWSLNNTSLNCTSPLTGKFFPYIVLHNARLVESEDTEWPMIWQNGQFRGLTIKLYVDLICSETHIRFFTCVSFLAEDPAFASLHEGHWLLGLGFLFLHKPGCTECRVWNLTSLILSLLFLKTRTEALCPWKALFLITNIWQLKLLQPYINLLLMEPEYFVEGINAALQVAGFITNFKKTNYSLNLLSSCFWT